jgi:2-haloacid dehalogenase
MRLDYRRDIRLIAMTLLLVLCSSSRMPAGAAGGKVKAIAFDAFVIFDPRPIVARAEELFPGHGASLCNEWRVRQFEYTWLRSMSNRYVDFWKVTEDALAYACRKEALSLTDDKRKDLMNAYLSLKAWPDVLPALQSLKASGVRLGFLSNFTPRMLDADIRGSGLEGIFEQVLSTDKVSTYKPDPRAYQMGVDAFALPREEMLFVAFAGWDAAGARSFGYPTFWANRSGQLPEELSATPDGEGKSLADLLTFIDRK